MHLKEIRLENFKSFAGKFRIPLEPGYTCITGPNGSGKSNIADAILFVLGPKSSKAIRAGRLTELIFNGGKSKKPALKCQVSLVFENSEGTIPVPDSEVVFTRIVKLSPANQLGYNSYFYVNGSQASLNRFEELLAHAGIASDGYNLVQQGDINRFVTMGAVDRRRVLEDIAGIRTFDEEIDKAKASESQVNGNLEKTGLILDELSRQSAQLRSQRDGALKRKSLEDELRKYKALHARKIVEELEADIAGIKANIAEHEADEAKRLEERRALDIRIREMASECDRCEAELQAKGGEDARKMKERADELKIAQARAKDALVTNQDRLDEARSGLKLLKDEARGKVRELEALRGSVAALEGQLAAARAEMAEAEKATKEHQDRFSRSDVTGRELTKRLLGARKELEDASKRLRETEVERERLSAKREAALSALAAAEEAASVQEFQLKDLNFHIRDLSKEVKEKGKDSDTVRREHAALVARERELAQESADLETAIAGLTRAYNNIRAELEAKDMVQRGYTAAVRAILELRDKGRMKGIVGSVAELINVPSEYSLAIEIAAGNRAQSVVVDSDETAAKAIEYLKRSGFGRVTFLPLNKMLPQRPRGKALMAQKESVGFAVDLIKFERSYEGAMWYVFGDTLVVSDLAKARELMGGVRLVTLEGELIEPAGAMIGGKVEQGRIKLGAGKEKELEKAGKELRAASEHSEHVSRELKEVRAKLADLETSLRSTSTDDADKEARLAAARSSLKEAEARLKTVREELSRKRADADAAEHALAPLSKLAPELRTEVERLEAETAKLNKELVQSAPAEASRAMRDAEARRTDAERSVARLDGQLSAEREKLKLHEEDAARHDAGIADLEARKTACEKEMSRLRQEEQRASSELSSHLKIFDSMDGELAGIRKRRDDAFREKTTLEGQLEQLRVKSDARNEYFIRLRTELSGKEGALAEKRKEVVDVVLQEGEAVPSAEQLDKFIRITEGKLEALGPVNMQAIDDYGKVEARMGELKERTHLLKDELKRLAAVVAEAMDKKTTGLLTVLEEVNGHFVKTYAALSNGGEASISLENPAEPFSGGLVMSARPPGKKVYRLEALSGGEKSVAALAFIFAVQTYKPSPFYLLDESDANLDALNAQASARMVRANAAHAQFLQITHRKVTLQEASALIGVTLQEQGVSTLVMKVDIDNDFKSDGDGAEEQKVEAGP